MTSMQTVIILVFVAWAFNSEAEDVGRLGFNYCAPPILPPSCVYNRSTFENPKLISLCQQKLQHYTESIFEYRRCLAQSMIKLNLEANSAIDRFNCMSKEGQCPVSPSPNGDERQ